jgi:outer membrane protein assembly factor BamD (BamD/ComL family)
MFLLVKNNYEYASKSIETKQLERYRACTDAFDAFFAQYPESAYLKEAELMARMAAKQIEKLKLKQE